MKKRLPTQTAPRGKAGGKRHSAHALLAAARGSAAGSRQNTTTATTTGHATPKCLPAMGQPAARQCWAELSRCPNVAAVCCSLRKPCHAPGPTPWPADTHTHACTRMHTQYIHTHARMEASLLPPGKKSRRKRRYSGYMDYCMLRHAAMRQHAHRPHTLCKQRGEEQVMMGVCTQAGLSPGAIAREVRKGGAWVACSASSPLQTTTNDDYVWPCVT